MQKTLQQKAQMRFTLTPPMNTAMTTRRDPAAGCGAAQCQQLPHLAWSSPCFHPLMRTRFRCLESLHKPIHSGAGWAPEHRQGLFSQLLENNSLDSTPWQQQVSGLANISYRGSEILNRAKRWLLLLHVTLSLHVSTAAPPKSCSCTHWA